MEAGREIDFIPINTMHWTNKIDNLLQSIKFRPYSFLVFQEKETECGDSILPRDGLWTFDLQFSFQQTDHVRIIDNILEII